MAELGSGFAGSSHGDFWGGAPGFLDRAGEGSPDGGRAETPIKSQNVLPLPDRFAVRLGLPDGAAERDWATQIRVGSEGPAEGLGGNRWGGVGAEDRDAVPERTRGRPGALGVDQVRSIRGRTGDSRKFDVQFCGRAVKMEVAVRSLFNRECSDANLSIRSSGCSGAGHPGRD